MSHVMNPFQRRTVAANTRRQYLFWAVLETPVNRVQAARACNHSQR